MDDVMNQNRYAMKRYKDKTNTVLDDFSVDFDRIGSMLIGGIELKTKIRYENIDDFENYDNAIDDDYYSEDVIFTGSLYKTNTPEFIQVSRSQYGGGADFTQDIVQ